MTVETFKLPDVGEGVAEGELVRWLVAVGDEVTEDQPLAAVETDKAVVDLPSPYEGTVTDRHVEEGEMVPVGSVIVSIEVADDEAASDTGEAGDEPVDEETADGAATTAGRVFAPPSTRRLARELGVDLGGVAGSGPGGRVTDADVRAAADESPAPRSVAPSSTVVLESTGADEPTTGDATTRGDGASATDANGASERTETHRESSTAVDRATEAVGQEHVDRARTLATPATRGLADELGVDLGAVPTDRARDGVPFVTREQVREYAERREAAAEPESGSESAAGATAAEPASTAGGSTAAEGPRPGDRIPYRGVRRSIGEQMERSKYTAPHVTHTDEVDVTALVETKADLEAYAAEEGVSLTYLPFVMRAVARALAEFPQVNAELDETAEEIVCHDAYNIGVATATDAGLMVPVVEDVDGKGLLELADETARKVARARDRSIEREEMQGGTFTITNVGVIGGEYATPIVNYPEVAILALGRIGERPRVVDGEVVPRHTLPLSLSVDHRVVDGAVAARFTNRVMELLASPARLLVE
ncbi:2-oxo acid dehydrogenase subunit E2 [Haloplanus litoreus]|uniref:2-oxo acid dehydrogenase subunit E2 n=1 Tax=Haloplanus litoreus TaxID=767515 RepID=UPI00363EF441